MFKGRDVVVKITGNALLEYEELNRVVGEELQKGIKGTKHQKLFNSIKNKIEFLKENPQYGTHIPRDRIPKEYIEKYEVTNLWKINLPDAWRIIYTINGNEIEIIALILDIITHKKYDKKFGYKTK